MDPIDISCPKCGRIFLYGHSCPSNECNEDSTSFLDKVEKFSKTHDESDGKSTNIESDFAAYDMGEFQKDSSHFRSSKEDPLISADNPPTSPSIGETFMEGNEEDSIEVTCAFDNRSENAPESLPILHIDTLYSGESTTFFPQSRNPLDGLQFEPLVIDDSSVSDEIKDKIDKTSDLCKKQGESSDADIALAIGDLKIESTSEDYYGSSALDSLQGNNELRRTFECSSLALPSCSHSGPSGSDRRGHKKSKSENSHKKKYTCGQCGYRLSSRESYRRHQLRRHTEERPFKCDCGRGFILKSILKAHQRRNSGACRFLPYKCMVCSMRFLNNSRLENHFRIHTGDQPFVCPICGRPFTRQSSLTRHRRSQTH